MDDTVDVVTDNTDEWEAAFEQAIARGLEEVGLAAEGHAKAICPVDTGRLRNSITHAQLDAHHEAIGANVEYARYVELGSAPRTRGDDPRWTTTNGRPSGCSPHTRG